MGQQQWNTMVRAVERMRFAEAMLGRGERGMDTLNVWVGAMQDARDYYAETDKRVRRSHRGELA